MGDHDSQSLDVDRRFSGLERIYGVDGAKAIRGSHVVVVGLGGVGSWAAEALARSGVNTLTLIDMDHVSESNINRQIQAHSQTLGMAKITAMQERIALINPHCHVHCIDAFVEADNFQTLLTSDVNAVIDACDQVSAKTAMALWARTQPAHFISVGAAGGKRQTHSIDIADLSAVTHDPLLAQVRYRLRKHHGAPKEGKKIGLACVFSKEPVMPPDASCDVQSDGSLNCHGYGSLVTVTASFGLSAAGWVIDEIYKNSQRERKNNAII
jgi:tRNA A37 threonylcarbamoyladenosine dehydratase